MTLVLVLWLNFPFFALLTCDYSLPQTFSGLACSLFATVCVSRISILLLSLNKLKFLIIWACLSLPPCLGWHSIVSEVVSEGDDPQNQGRYRTEPLEHKASMNCLLLLVWWVFSWVLSSFLLAKFSTFIRDLGKDRLSFWWRLIWFLN